MKLLTLLAKLFEWIVLTVDTMHFLHAKVNHISAPCDAERHQLSGAAHLPSVQAVEAVYLRAAHMPITMQSKHV